MANPDTAKAHKDWRRAEEAYAKAIEPFLGATDGDGAVTKKSAARLSQLRGKADDRLQKYLKRSLK